MLVDQKGQQLESTSRWVRFKKRAAGAWKRLVVLAGGMTIIALLLANVSGIAKLFGIPWGEPSPVPQEQTGSTQAGTTALKQVRVPANASALTPDYMRLFGAMEVPLLMTLLQEGPDLHFQPMPERSTEVRPAYGDTASGVAVDEKMYEFWRDFKYRKARPTAGGLWQMVMNDSAGFGLNMYYSALMPTKEDAISFAVSYPDESGNGTLIEETAAALRLSVEDSWRDHPPGTRDEDVAYLFLVLKNTSGETLRDVDMTSFEYANRLRRRDFYADGYSVLGTLSWPDPRATALTDAAIKGMTGRRSIRSIASIAPDETFIWLLAVYHAKQNGLPEFYLTSVFVPVETTYTIRGSRVTAPVRPPYRERAERILVPYGWLGQ